MTVPGLRRAIAQLVGNVPESLRIGGMPTEEPAPVFYSALERFIENNPTQRAPVSQWRGMIQNAPGIKAEEIDAVTHGDPDKWWRHVAFGEGLDDVGDPEVVGRHRITREAILNALRRDRVNLDERVAGGAPGAATENNRSDLPTRDEVVQRIEEDYMDEIDESARNATDFDFDYDYRSPRDEWEIIPHHPQDPPPRMIPRDRETGDLFGDPDPYRIGAGELPAPEDRQLQYWIAQQFRRIQRAPDHTPMVAAAQNPRPPVGEADLYAPYQGRYDRPDEYEWGLPSEDSGFPSRYWSDGLSSEALDRYRAIADAPGASALQYNQRSARYRENAFGPFRTQEEAEAAMDELEEAHRYAARMDYDESDVYHRNWAEARDEYVNRYLDGYEYDEMDGGDVGVRWREWSMPGNGNGGTNYGEMVIRMPKNPLGGDFSYFHWPADENPIAHVRFHDRDVEGKRTLFIEEMQSDWHQKGREGGYRGTDSPELTERVRVANEAENNARIELEAANDEVIRMVRALPMESLAQVAEGYWGRAQAERLRQVGAGLLSDRDAFQFSDVIAEGTLDFGIAPEAREALMRARDVEEGLRTRVRELSGARRALEEQTTRNNPVENAPFKNNSWAELSMKRMIRWASDHGYDQIAWSGRVKNGSVYRGSDLPAGHEFYDKILNNITNGIVKKSGGRVKRVNMGFASGTSRGGSFPDTAVSIANGSLPVSDLPEGARGAAQRFLDAWQAGEKAQATRIANEQLLPALREAGLDSPPPDANVLELTPELKRKAQREGFPLYILPALMGGGAEAIRRMLAEDREERA